ncbi:hypothetical protein VOLCADRAFT_100932 [Volvox carteri f. nagariensis]|uniref:DUF6570 domain-containing protein n=1 Tax=Volvox carteri f. nagariensis TaxID=3068 RepID=D8ULD0_VOLCA|nr:uncharacterized protein VOLCADRAFT_100932 [Volvox carteri f. nagariensis]EFJ39467.1 hypothetical protein VOLCADRAFT_100932 [Volvox carteri f. nagariensis]|eukprot:XP_002959466.1 hypothetical protein VOLCADRAFT_100932 [Volvox carteri f. nagariensis]
MCAIGPRVHLLILSNGSRIKFIIRIQDTILPNSGTAQHTSILYRCTVFHWPSTAFLEDRRITCRDISLTGHFYGQFWFRCPVRMQPERCRREPTGRLSKWRWIEQQLQRDGQMHEPTGHLSKWWRTEQQLLLAAAQRQPPHARLHGGRAQHGGRKSADMGYSEVLPAGHRHVARIDMTDAYYHNVHANLRGVATATGLPILMFNVNPADLHSAAAVVAAGQFLEFGEDGAPLWEERVMDKWWRVRNNPCTSQALLNTVKIAFMDILFGFKPGDKRQSNPDCFCGTVFHICICYMAARVRRTLCTTHPHLAWESKLRSTSRRAAVPFAAQRGPVVRLSGAFWKFRVGSVPYTLKTVPQRTILDYSREDVLASNFPTAFLYTKGGIRPLGMSNRTFFQHVSTRVPQRQLSGNLLMLACMVDVLNMEDAKVQTWVTVKCCQQDIDTVGAIPREAVKVMADILALPKMHPDRRHLLQDMSPLVHTLITSLRAAAVVAAGQFLEFGEDGAPLWEERVMDKWWRVRNNPCTSQALLNTVKLAFMDILFGFKPGDKRQSNPDCFCGTVFHICICYMAARAPYAPHTHTWPGSRSYGPLRGAPRSGAFWKFRVGSVPYVLKTAPERSGNNARLQGVWTMRAIGTNCENACTYTTDALSLRGSATCNIVERSTGFLQSLRSTSSPVATAPLIQQDESAARRERRQRLQQEDPAAAAAALQRDSATQPRFGHPALPRHYSMIQPPGVSDGSDCSRRTQPAATAALQHDSATRRERRERLQQEDPAAAAAAVQHDSATRRERRERLQQEDPAAAAAAVQHDSATRCERWERLQQEDPAAAAAALQHESATRRERRERLQQEDPAAAAAALQHESATRRERRERLQQEDPAAAAVAVQHDSATRRERRQRLQQERGRESTLLDRLNSLLQLDYLHGDRPIELPDFLMALPDGRVEDLPDSQLPVERQVPYDVQLQTASSMAAALRRCMPSHVCAVCSELCSSDSCSMYSFHGIPNVDLLRADIPCTMAVPRRAHTLTWRHMAHTVEGEAPSPPDPVLPVRYRIRRNDRRNTAPGEDAAGASGSGVAMLLDDDIRGAHSGTSEEDEIAQAAPEAPSQQLPPELQPKPPRVLPQPCPTDSASVEILYCIRLEPDLPNRTMLVDAAGMERIFVCKDCEAALSVRRIPDAALARLDPGDVPLSNHLGEPLPLPTFLESQVLARAHILQQVIVLHLGGRPPEVFPQAVRAHGVALANPGRHLWRGLIPAALAEMAGCITVVCVDHVRNRHELRERVRSAPALQMRGPVIVAWVRYLQHLDEEEWAIDPVALQEYEKMGCAPFVPEVLLDNAVGPIDEEVAGVLRSTFMHGRTGAAGVRQQQDEIEAAVAEAGMETAGAHASTIAEAANGADMDVDAASAAEAAAAVSARDEQEDDQDSLLGGRPFVAFVHTPSTTAEPIAGAEPSQPGTTTEPVAGAEPPEPGTLDELELVVPQPSHLPNDGSEIDTCPWRVEEMLTGRSKLVLCGGDYARQPLDERHPAILAVCFPTAFPYGLSGQRPPGMSYSVYCKHLIRRVPRKQFSGNPMLLARMYDISLRQATMAQVGVTMRIKPHLERDLTRLPRDVVRAMADILALLYSHPQRRALLVQQSPLVQTLVEGTRRSTVHVDLTDAYYNGAQAQMRAAAMAIGWPTLFFNINPADMHAAAAIVASGQVVEFGEDGRPQNIPSTVERWRRVRDDPYSCAMLLVATKEVLVEQLFGFAPGAQEQSNTNCFCGRTFEVVTKVEQSGRLALHVHGVAHVATFAVERLQALFNGPNCRALALAYALCQQWYPSPYYDPSVPEDSRRVFQMSPEETAQHGIPPPAADKCCPRAAYNFERLAGCSNGGLPPHEKHAACHAHHAAVLRTTLTHTHSDVCVRHGCTGTDGSCGMAFPRIIRHLFRWIGTQGLFLLPRLGHNVVPHFPAAALAFGCNHLFSLACEVDRAYTTEVAAQLETAADGNETPAPEELLGSATDPARDVAYYTPKYTAKTIERSQADRLCNAVARVQDFLLSGVPPPPVNNPDLTATTPTALGNLAAAAHRMTATITVGMALAAFKLSGYDTFQASYQRSYLPVGGFTALANTPGAGPDNEDGAVEVALVNTDTNTGDYVISNTVQNYILRGPELSGLECSAYTLASNYSLARVQPAQHLHATTLQGMVLPSRHGRKRTATNSAVLTPSVDGTSPNQPAPTTCIPGPSVPTVTSPPPLEQLPSGTSSVTNATRLVALHPSHPLYLSHVLKHHPRPQYVLLGGSLPRRPTERTKPTDADEYYAFVLGTFKSHRGAPVPPNLTVQQAYDEWWSELATTESGRRYQQCVAAILDNIEQDHAACAHHTEQYNQRRRKHKLPTEDPGGYRADDDDDGNAEAQDAHFETHPETWPASDTQIEQGHPQQPRPAPTAGLDLAATPIGTLFDRTTASGLYAYDAVVRCPVPVLVSGHGTSASYLLHRVNAADMTALEEAARRLKRYTTNTTPQDGVEPDRRLSLHRQTSSVSPIVAIIEVEGRAPEPVPAGKTPPYIRLPQLPTIEDTIHLFTLSPEQAVPFILMARYFDHRTEPDPGLPPRMLVVGRPGTGKSQFVHALLWYTFQHGVPEWPATCAYAWTAAAAFHNDTHRSLSTHAMFGLAAMGIGHRRSKRGSAVALQVHRNVGSGAIIIDEIGMSSIEHLGAIYNACNKHLTCTCPPQTRQHTYWQAGQQLGESTSEDEHTVTSDSSTDNNAAPSTRHRHPVPQTRDHIHNGFILYRNLAQDVFLLTRQQRQNNTPSGIYLTEASTMFAGGPVTRERIEELVDKLNARAISSLSALTPLKPRVVVQRNEPRHALNTRLMMLQAQHLSKRLVVWNADHIPHQPRGTAPQAPLTRVEQAVAMRVKDAEFDHTTADTWYYEGAPYILLDTACAEAGAFHNNEVEACGLLMDEREPPDDGTGPYRRLQYLPAAILVRPIHGHKPTTILQGSHDLASHGATFALRPRASKEPATVLMPATNTGTAPKAIKRINFGLGDWFVVTDHWVQGRTFRECWVVDLSVPPKGIKRATLFVLLTRFKSLDDIHLLRPLYTTPTERRSVVTAFQRATRLTDDLAAELRLLDATAADTHRRYRNEFRWAEQLEMRRAPDTAT